MSSVLSVRRVLDALPITVFLLLFVYLSVKSTNFLSLPTMELILKQAVPTVLVSLGLATVIIAGGDDVVSGGIDLSIPATAIISAAAVGVTKVITESRRIGVTDPTIVFIRDGEIAGVAASVVLTSVIALAFWHLVHRTKWGMSLQATGGSRDAAEVSGIATNRFVVQSFLLAAFAGWRFVGGFHLDRGERLLDGVHQGSAHTVGRRFGSSGA